MPIHQSRVITRGLGPDSDVATRGFGDDFPQPPVVRHAGLPSFKGRRSEPRGIRWANVKQGRPENVVHGGARVVRVNSVQNVTQEPIDKSITDVSGRVAFRFQKGPTQVPVKVRHYARGSVNRFGEPTFPGVS